MENEINAIRNTLGNQYSVKSTTSWDNKPIDANGFDGIVLDSHFTPAQGLDFLMEVSRNAHIPFLLITDPEDPQCAIESRPLGAFNYLVKTERLPSVIGLAVREMILTFKDQVELNGTVLAL